MRFATLVTGACAALVLSGAGAAQAAVITVSLGDSAQTFTQYGQGIDGSGRGTFREEQGSSSFDGVTSTFLLSGAILSSNTPALNSGTWEFITTYAGANTPQAGPNAPWGRTNAANPLQFNYLSLDPSTRMTLILHTPTGDVSHVFYDGANFGGGFSFVIQNGICTGLDALPCTQMNVGETAGSTLSGPVRMFVSWDTGAAVPEPATWATMIIGFGLVGAVLRRRRRGVEGSHKAHLAVT